MNRMGGRMQKSPSRVEGSADLVVRNVDEIDQEELEEREVMKTDKRIILVAYVVVVILGVATGYMLAARGGGGGFIANTPSAVKTDKVEGITDTKTFKDSAEGVVEAGGLEGEGSHKLIREGGPSQTAYLVSSVIDLDEYVGKRVRVWGQTMAAKKVSWLMDVGKIERLE